MATEKPHHHGDLRNALIDAATEIIVAGGPDALTLRKAAARAGVSHAAPAHHFKGLLSLKGAVIARSHRLFAAMMEAHAARARNTPQAQLLAISEGYVAFSREHPSLFKFMFQPHDYTPDMFDETTREELMQSSAASYMILRQACAPFEHPSGKDTATETMIWSLVHGYALLFTGKESAGPEQHAPPEIADILPRLQLKKTA